MRSLRSLIDICIVFCTRGGEIATAASVSFSEFSAGKHVKLPEGNETLRWRRASVRICAFARQLQDEMGPIG